MLWPLLFLAVGIACLVKGADWLVDGASRIARAFGISDLLVGLTIVAFGTSAPELVVSVVASMTGNSAIAIGNVVGSNTANILFIIGICAMIYPLSVTQSTVWKEIPFMLLSSVVLTIMVNDPLTDGAEEQILGRGDALVLLSFFAIFLYYTGQLAMQQSRDTATDGSPRPRVGYAPLMTVAGLALLILGGRWVVSGASDLAASLGVSQNLIGLTVVAVGTSLPELATSAMAAYRKNADIAVGNIVGSNIFNVLFILGVSGMIAPLPFLAGSNVDVAVMLAATVALFIAMFTGRPRRQVQRFEGAAFIAAYVSYVVFLVIRG